MSSIYRGLIEIEIAPAPAPAAREEGTCCKCGETFAYINELGYCPLTKRDDCGDEKFSGKKKSVDLHQGSRLVLV
jgi:hypothetical protein